MIQSNPVNTDTEETMETVRRAPKDHGDFPTDTEDTMESVRIKRVYMNDVIVLYLFVFFLEKVQ